MAAFVFLNTRDSKSSALRQLMIELVNNGTNIKLDAKFSTTCEVFKFVLKPWWSSKVSSPFSSDLSIPTYFFQYVMATFG